MTLTYDDFQAATEAVQARIHIQPKVGLILGSGLGSLADAIEDAVRIPYSEIPHWHTGNVIGHAGRLVIGHLEGQAILAMQGRIHLYEGVDSAAIGLPIRVMQLLGVETLIVTNAAGGVNKDYKAGDLMLIKDHISWAGLAGHNPLMGPNDDRLGLRFPPLTRAYDPKLRQLARDVAAEAGIPLQEGVYVAVSGPAFETPAEIRMVRLIGGDAVGMSTAPEVTVANHAGIRVLGISSITNECIDDVDAIATVNHEEVLEIGMQIVPRLITILKGVLRALPA